jgi:CHAT domain-containing protein/Tfp pilus assembly protein PilF
VETVDPGGVAHGAGIRVGDLLTAARWSDPIGDSRPPGRTLDSPFDLSWAEAEKAPRGRVTLVGLRDGEDFTVTLPPGEWGLGTRPHMDAEALSRYLEALRLLQQGEPQPAESRLLMLRQEARSARDWSRACWLSIRIAERLGEGVGLTRTTDAYEQAAPDCQQAADPFALGICWESRAALLQRHKDLASASQAYETVLAHYRAALPGSLVLARAASRHGDLLAKRGLLEAAERAHREAHEIRERLAPESLELAGSLNSLGVVADLRGDLAAAESLYRRALAIREKLAPESLATASSYNNLGVLADLRGDLDGAERLYARGLSLREKLAPEGLEVASSLNNLALVAHGRGDFRAAEAYYGRSLKIKERLAPESLETAYVYNNLGIVLSDRGDLTGAEQLYQRALTVREKLAPGSRTVASTLNNLGVLAERRGDPALAEERYRRALAIWEALAPESLECAYVYNNLGNVLAQREELAGAEALYRRALAIRTRLAPGSLSVASTWINLAKLEERRGDLAGGEALARTALEIAQAVAPDHLLVGEALSLLGDLVRRRGDPVRARELLEDGLTIRRRTAPGSRYEAESCRLLAALAGDSPNPQQAVHFFECALEALEAQEARLGGSQESRAGFAEAYRDYHREYLELLLRLGSREEALHVLERSRARLMLEMLAERDLLLDRDAPGGLDAQRRRVALEYEKTQAALAALDPERQRPQAELLSKLRELRAQQAAIADAIRSSSPRLASLRYPQPLTLAGIRASLDPGTVLLSYSVGDEQSHLFAVSDERFEVFPLGLGRSALQARVEAFRARLTAAPPASARERAELRASGGQLYELLLRPAEGVLERGRRLAIVPDGALHLLPFAALVRDKPNGWEYLAEWKPLHTVLSATLYAELIKRRLPRSNRASTPTLVAFGDPDYGRAGSAAADPDPALRSLLRGERALRALPGTRTEVQGIGELFRRGSLLYLSEQATEERAKRVPRDVRYLHFACHGLLDARFPLDSALALSLPPEREAGRENGLLQAWEVFEQVRVDADLVVLSGCDTGLGRHAEGEGLIGLTRAFQYAGARSVLASLWSVADQATAELMRRFYSHLRKGRPKDEALRLAQLELIREARGIRDRAGEPLEVDVSAPFFWAGLQLIGDWR